jgi:hypothetical protein
LQRSAENVRPVWADDRPAQSQCIIIRSIDNWTDLDDRTVILETSPTHHYRVTFAVPCREMSRAAFVRVAGSRSMCLRRGDVLVFGDALPIRGQRWLSERCIIDSIERVPARSSLDDDD